MHTIIVGTGIAGLWLAEQLALKGDRVTLLEKADYLGGRILTSSIGFEIGAGRISTTHQRVLELLDRFGLQTFPIPSGDLWKALGDTHSQKNPFLDTWIPIVKMIAALDPKILGTHTLRDLAVKTIGPILTEQMLQQYGFRAETEVLRADLGVKAFQGDMSSAARFLSVKGGLSLLIGALEKACRAAGVRIRMNTPVTDVTDSYKVHTSGETILCDRVILALPVEALRHMHCMQRLPLLRHLKMEPLTRIYCKFATPWTHKKLVTDSPLRFIIPIIPELGLVMISYTEAQDTKTFRGLSGLTLIAALQSELLRLFPTEKVPLILWAQAYEWAHGCTYWLPGSYDPVVESKKALQPFPGKAIHLCNESFSLHQAWIEGALDHAAALRDMII